MIAPKEALSIYLNGFALASYLPRGFCIFFHFPSFAQNICNLITAAAPSGRADFVVHISFSPLGRSVPLNFVVSGETEEDEKKENIL